MKRLHYFSLFLLMLSMPVLSQDRNDTSRAHRNSKEIKFPANSNILHQSPEKIQLFNEKIGIPFNLKIYQRVILNEYVTHRKLSPEELSTGMSEDQLNSFEQNRLKFRRMLSDLYGEDLIDIDSLLSSIGITREQLIGVVAILKFFLM